jgi:hypothetical protein
MSCASGSLPELAPVGLVELEQPLPMAAMATSGIHVPFTT